jgi:hypothetical protein
MAVGAQSAASSDSIIIDSGLMEKALVAHASACCGGLQPDVQLFISFVKNKAGQDTRLD